MDSIKFYFIFILIAFSSFCSQAQEVSTEIELLKNEIELLKEKVIILNDTKQKVETSLDNLKSKQINSAKRISSLEKENISLKESIDSITAKYSILSDNQKHDKEHLILQIGNTKEEIKENKDLLSQRTNIGVFSFILIIIMIIVIIILFLKKYKKGINTMDEVRKAQGVLEQAQKSLEEESLKLDNKLLEVVDKYVANLKTSDNTSSNNTEMDHSLALKVADEIVRIEANLSRMDANIKGYKQLSKGVQRIKDNFMANDYEIVDMLGKTYQPGTKAIATFITDENLKPGQQIITRIIKPQVNYKQRMIQAAQIEVSQAE